MEKCKGHSDLTSPLQAGFTLIESLISLMIVSLILALPSYHSKQYAIRLEEELFFNQVESKMNEMQMQAITSNKMTHVRFLKDGIVFKSSIRAGEIERCLIRYPESVGLINNHLYFDFKGGSGRTNRFKRLRFTTSKGELNLVFQISNGRYHFTRPS